MLHRIIRSSSGQIDTLSILEELKDVELQAAFEVLENSFARKPVQMVIFEMNNVQVLSQGSQDLLRRLVRLLLSKSVSITFSGTGLLDPVVLIEITQGNPVFETSDQAEAFFLKQTTVGPPIVHGVDHQSGAIEQRELTEEMFVSKVDSIAEEDAEPAIETELERESSREELVSQQFNHEQELKEKQPGEVRVKRESEKESKQDMILPVYGEQSRPGPAEFPEEKTTDAGPEYSIGPGARRAEQDMLLLVYRIGCLLLLLLAVVSVVLILRIYPDVQSGGFSDLFSGLPLTETSETDSVKALDVQEQSQSNRIWSALENGELERVEELLNAGVDTEIRDRQKHTPLMKAVAHQNPEMVRLLVRRGARVNVSDELGDTPLVWAASKDHMEMVRILLDHGADPDRGMFTAMMWAALHGNVEMVVMLLGSRGDADLRSREGWTALMWASERGHGPVVERLLAARVSINAQNREGYTALMLAVRRGRERVVKILLKKGADRSISGFDRKTALDLAREFKRMHLIPMLIR